jgi:beta-lactamase regulating signal transducer with metallopeptidase domain
MHMLIATTIASSIAVLLVGALRKPLRRIAGSQSAYWLWSLVPATALAVFLPAASRPQQPLPGTINEVLSNTVMTVAASRAAADYMQLGLAVWLLGAFVIAALLIARQGAFVRSLGRMSTGPDGVLYSDSIVGPMVLGAWRARVIVPTDFALRYTPEERLLMLAHEQAHLQRGDTFTNIAAAAWLCLFWFNPLMYWAVGRLHFDQELACDALVLLRRATGRKLYAGALLKAQMHPESSWRTPIGCHWKSSHPLKERIAVLKYSFPGPVRRMSGVAVCVALCLSGIYAVTIASGAAPLQDTSAASAPNGVDWKAQSIDLDIQRQNVHDVLMMIARKTGRRLIFSDQAQQKLKKEQAQTMMTHFVDIPVSGLLDVMAKIGGLSIKQSGGVIFVDVAR